MGGWALPVAGSTILLREPEAEDLHSLLDTLFKGGKFPFLTVAQVILSWSKGDSCGPATARLSLY